MRAIEFLKEDLAPAATKKVGRDFNHLEDWVFAEPGGYKRAIKVLRDVTKSSKDVSHKWDGAPTVFWGREPNGQFRFVGNNNWGKPEGQSNSPEELKQFILSRGKGEDWRPAFADSMAALWPIFEAATPRDFRGYVYGDMLFHPGKPYQGLDGKLIFTPNETTYNVAVSSPTGQRMVGKKAAVAGHFILENFGDAKTSGQPFTEEKQFNSNKQLAVFSQNYVSHQPTIDKTVIDEIETLGSRQGKAIDDMLAPQPQFGYFRNSVYSFVNAQSQANQLDQINSDAFFAWLQKDAAKLKKIHARSQQFEGVLDSMFDLVRAVMTAKNSIIDQLDSAEGDITATTKGQPGGEGYMKVSDQTKLVPRHRWKPFRAD